MKRSYLHLSYLNIAGRLCAVAVLGLLCLVLCREAAVAGPKRNPAVAGTFYPAGAVALKKAVDGYLKKAPSPKKLPGPLICLLVPHAGYEFSAGVAAAGYRAVTKDYPTVVLIGAAHTVPVKGAAVYPSGSFATPLGDVPIDKKLCRSLLEGFPLLFEDSVTAHLMEHSLEVQLPFLIRIFKSPFKIVPIVINTDDLDTAVKIGSALAKVIKGKNVLIVVSSDFSHYPPKDIARKADLTILETLKRLDPAYFWLSSRILMRRREKNLQTTACGEAAIIAGMTAAVSLGADKAVLLDYANSGEIRPETAQRAVGYGAMAFVKTGEPVPESFPPSGADRKLLLQTARQVIVDAFDKKPYESGLSSNITMNMPSAVFVTLTKSGKLRGCIGTTEPQMILKDAVVHAAHSAAFNDHRFPPLKKSELSDIHIEISILSPMKTVKSHKSVVPRKHGVALSRDEQGGLFLPQVWEQIPGKEDFLSEICSQKAGLPRDCWKDPKTKIQTFTVYSFEEARKH